jgi:hypothetical protein
VHSYNHSNHRHIGNLVKTGITMIIITRVTLVTKVIINVCGSSCKETEGSHGNDYEDCSFLGYDVM